MNYIAHIHLAHETQTSLEGNFLGDFVKGADLSHLPTAIQTGVTLHRKVDSFTDRHHQLSGLKSTFPPGLRRVAGICLDVYFDYFLCQHWSVFCTLPQRTLLNRFYSQLEQSQLGISPQYQQVKTGLIEYQWLQNYGSAQGVENAFKSIQKRLNGKIIFADSALRFLFEHQQVIEKTFLRFYPELLEYASEVSQADTYLKEAPLCPSTK